MAMRTKKRTLLALSGGVDSSVSGALLKKKGGEVEAGFMCNYRDPDPKCSYPQDKKWSRAVARFLKIPWHEFNFEAIYKKKVLDYFYAGYQKGETPNPDMFCNQAVKFGAFPKEAKKRNFNLVAFGHYARLKKVRAQEMGKLLGRRTGAGRKSTDRFVLLLRGKDKNKDQSYFLAQLTQRQLRNVIFPVGHLTKRQVRMLASDFGLPSRERKDSTGICSVGQLDLMDFLKRRIKEKRGPIYDLRGKKVGEHQGIFFYTIGQRRGFGLALGKPHFIVAKDLKKNALVVAPEKDRSIYSSWVDVRGVVWTYGKPRLPLSCEVQVRYRQRALPATLKKGLRGGIRIQFRSAVWGAARGQFAVFYGATSRKNKKEIVLGSGAIKRAEGEEKALARLKKFWS